jgi:hypothetical protein
MSTAGTVPGILRAAAVGLAAGTVAWAALRLRRTAEARIPQLVRTNHAGDPVSLVEGPVAAGGLLVAAACVPGAGPRAAALTAVGVAGVLGAVDDFAERGASKGLRGHLGALRRGRVTTGALKVIGIPVASVAAAALLRTDATTAAGRAVDAVLAGGVIAGTANLLNLLDLRPGRALKAGLVIACVQTLVDGPRATAGSGAVGAGVVGVTAALLPDGANALGAALGLRAALTASRPRLVCELAGLAALTLASERVSFTRVIERTPGLREFDALGR